MRENPDDLAGRDRQRELTRRRVYEAAVEVFRRDGVAACRIDDIAKLAGVSRGTFYFHYPAKHDVLVQLLRESERSVVTVLGELPKATSLPEVLEATSEAIARSWQQDPKLILEIASTGLKLVAGNLERDAEPVRAALTPYFKAAAERGELIELLPPEALADFFLVNTLAAMVAWCGNPTFTLREVLRGVSVLFLRGAAAPGR
ncbi:MAG: TetR/AcrR family transcriptional regulator [Myxococcaceae bacterium]